MRAAAYIEDLGIPIDMPRLTLLKAHWSAIQDELIRRIDATYGVYEGRSFKSERFAQYLVRNAIPWPSLAFRRIGLER